MPLKCPLESYERFFVDSTVVLEKFKHCYFLRFHTNKTDKYLVRSELIL